MELYNDFIIDLLDNYIDVIMILQKYLNFINTDVKLNNIFIKYSKNTNSKYDKLRKLGFFIDFTLLLSDMEKSFCYINGVKIMSSEKKSIIKNKLLSLLKVSSLEKIRFNCTYDFKLNCNLPVNKFDLLTLTIDLYSKYIYNFKNINIFKKIDTYLCNKLEFNETQFKNLIKIIKNYNFYYIYNRDIHIRKSLYSFCLKNKKSIKKV